MSVTSSATIFCTDLSPCGRCFSARSSPGCWIIRGKQSLPKALQIRDPRFESRCTPESFTKIRRPVLRGFGIREWHCHVGGSNGGNRGGNPAGDGGRDGDDDGGFNGDNDYFILHWWRLSINGLIIYWQVFFRNKMALIRALVSLYVAGYLCYTQLFSALAGTAANGCPNSEDSSTHSSLAGVEIKPGAEVNEKGEMPDVVWEVKGGRWRRVLLDHLRDEFVVDGSRGRQDEALTSEVEKKNENFRLVFGKRGPESIFVSSLTWCKDLILRLMLPEGYPQSVTGDYLEYSLWRMGQVIASQIGGVLTTQALLYAVGLGKGAIPTAAAVNWVLKDGIGYLSKILLSKYGRHFDVHPKGWRLFADLLENAACGLIFIEYLHSGCIPSIKEVNNEEPIFATIPLFSDMLKSCQQSSQALSVESKEAAAQIDAELQLGSKFKDVVHNLEEANALFNLYQNEQYLLAKHNGKFLVMLKGGATPQDMLRAMFQVCHLCWLERHLGIISRGTIDDCKPGGKLAISHDYLEREFTNVQHSATKVGWLAEGLVARPLPFRVHFNYVIP